MIDSPDSSVRSQDQADSEIAKEHFTHDLARPQGELKLQLGRILVGDQTVEPVQLAAVELGLLAGDLVASMPPSRSRAGRS